MVRDGDVIALHARRLAGRALLDDGDVHAAPGEVHRETKPYWPASHDDDGHLRTH